VSRGAKLKVAAAVSALAVIGGIGCFPVYGAPGNCKSSGSNCVDECEIQLADGGDPKADSTNACFVDGGTP